ncbi:MAG: cytochrome P450 [Myxococcales bacterium]|nr:cytochrome P450 [Myxococcales bacterium]
MTAAAPSPASPTRSKAPAPSPTPARPTANVGRAPGPRDRIGLRNVARFATGTLPFLRGMADRYGDVVQMKIFGKEYFLVSHPDDIENVLVKQAASMGRDEYIETLKRTLGEGLLTSDGDLWKHQRKLMSQAFTPKRIRSYGDTMASVTEASLHYRDGDLVNIHAEMSRITMEVVAAVLFGATIGQREFDLVGKSMETLNTYYANSPEAILILPRWVPTPLNMRVNAAVERLDGLIYSIIAKRRAARSSSKVGDGAEPTRDLLDVLLSAQDDGGSAMSDQQLRDEAMTLFLAGHETTALALAHTFYLLSKHPHVEQRLRAELDDVLGDRLPTAEDAKQLVYTERVLKEAMRLYPPAWTTGRQVNEEVMVGGYRVPVGSQILVSQWVVHRDARFYPDPEAFDPDRWEPERAKIIPRYAYFPFGGGPRICIGNHFAMLEATLILAIVLRRFHFELLPGQTLAFNPSVTLRQKGPGLQMRVRAQR